MKARSVLNHVSVCKLVLHRACAYVCVCVCVCVSQCARDGSPAGVMREKVVGRGGAGQKRGSGLRAKSECPRTLIQGDSKKRTFPDIFRARRGRGSGRGGRGSGDHQNIEMSADINLSGP